MVDYFPVEFIEKIGYSRKMECGQEKIGIAERRRKLGLSVYRLARLAGVKWQTAQDADRGIRKPHPGTLRKLEQALADYERAQVEES